MKRKRRSCYLIIFALIITIVTFRLIMNSSWDMKLLLRQHGGDNSAGTNAKKRILLYTPLFGKTPWNNVPVSYDFTNFDGSKCPVSSCQLTYDKEHLHTSDLVVFSGVDLPSPDHLRSISNYPQRRRQVWLYFMHESPWFINTIFPPYSGFFNWTASYRPDSEVFVPYHYHKPLQKKEEAPQMDANFAAGKKNRVSVVHSHCDDDRMRFITELRKYTQVDMYGGCAYKFTPQTRSCPRSSKECDIIQQEYKFYLAIENSFCTGYVTEKYWLNALAKGLVPIVMGGAAYNDSRIAIPGSYINARDFKSLKQLGDYINYLDRNDTAYNAYHQWRFQYALHVDNAMCLFCKAAHTHVPEKTVDLEEFWGRRNCDGKKPFLNMLIKESKASKL